MKQIMNYLNS